MGAARKLLVDVVTGWFSTLGDTLRNLLLLPAGKGGGESSRSVDPDFDGWVANDPMVTLNPASRYGDDATGFLTGSESDNPQPGAKDD